MNIALGKCVKDTNFSKNKVGNKHEQVVLKYLLKKCNFCFSLVKLAPDIISDRDFWWGHWKR